MASPTIGTAANLRGDLRDHVQAVAFPTNLIGNRIAPYLGLPNQGGNYVKISRGASQVNKITAQKRAPKAGYARNETKFGSDSYLCSEYGEEEVIDDSLKTNYARFFDMEKFAAERLRNNLEVGHEKRVADLIFNATNLNATNSLTAWTTGNIATFDAPQDIQAAVEKMNKRNYGGNLAIVINRPMFNLVIRSDKMQTFVRGAIGTYGPAALKPSDVVSAFDYLGVKELLIADSGYDTADEGLTASDSFIWGNAYVAILKLGAGDVSAGGVARTFSWSEDGGDLTVESYREEKTRGDVLRVRQNVVEKIIDENAGELIATQN